MLKEAPAPISLTSLRPLTLACFGRGGSNIVFSALGSARGTLTMDREWHQAVFENADWLKRVLRRSARMGLGHRLGTGGGPVDRAIRRSVRGRIAADIRQTPPWIGGEADWLVIKLMDHNVIRHRLIERTLGAGRTIVLTRAALPHCESLMRSGLSLDAACAWYRDVARALGALRRTPGTVVVRFEDLIAEPLETLETMFKHLGLRPPDIYYLKDKAFGTERVADTDVTHAAVRPIAGPGLRGFVRPDVNRAAVSRLTGAERDAIRRQTTEAAADLGYTPNAC